jgi:hypothetical protein
MAAEAGKGSKPRPYSVDQTTFDSNWDAIFGKKEQSAEENNIQSAEQGITDHSKEDQ